MQDGTLSNDAGARRRQRSGERKSKPAIKGRGCFTAAAAGPAVSDRELSDRRWHLVGADHHDSFKRALAVCEAAFDAIVDKSADGVIVVDPGGIICFANAAAETMLGRSTGELLGEPFGVPVAPGKTAEIDLLRDGVPSRVAEMRVVATQWQGNAAFLATLRDVTERKRAEEKARESVRRRDEFLAILSHELRNPLAAIFNAASVLAIADLDQGTFAKARNVIERQCGQMTRLLEGLLDVSRVARSKIELHKESLDISQIVADAVDAVRSQVDGARQVLTLNVPAGPLSVEGDAARLQQVLVNLLSNACKFSKCGGRIELSVVADGDQAVIRVKDEGVGLSSEMLEAVFEPFVQFESSLDRAEVGLGLGLAVVEGLVRLHGGTVRAESAGRNQGSEFIVTLPLSKAGLKDGAAQPGEAPGSPLRLLLVEDNADVGAMLKTILEHAGHDVEIAEDGLRGLELIEFQHPDVALVDIGLPGLNGYELAKRVRAKPDCSNVFLIAVTGYGQPCDRKRAMAAGFDAHLAKPVSVEQLHEILASVRRTKPALST